MIFFLTMGTWIWRKKNGALPSILCVALMFLRVSATGSLSSSPDTLYPSVDESNSTRNPADSNDIPGILKDRTLKENRFQKPTYQQTYSGDNSDDVKENDVDLNTDDSNTNPKFSQLLNAKIRKATIRFLHKRPWFHSWSGRKREDDDLDWEYPKEEIDQGFKAPKPEIKESHFGDASPSTDAVSLHKIKRAHSNSRPQGTFFTASRSDQISSDSAKIKSKSTKTKHISENKFKSTKMNENQKVKTKAGYSEAVQIKVTKSRLKRSASIVPFSDEVFLQLNSGEKIDNDDPENIPSVHKDEIKSLGHSFVSLGNSFVDPEIGFYPHHGVLNLKDSPETKKTVEVINDCFELLKGPDCIRLMNNVINDISQMTNNPPDTSLGNFQEDDEISNDLIATSPNEHAFSSGAVDYIRSLDKEEPGLEDDPESMSEFKQGALAESDNINKAQLGNKTALAKAVENVLSVESTKAKDTEIPKNTESLLATSDESNLKDQNFGFRPLMNPSSNAYTNFQASEPAWNYKSNPARTRYTNEINGGISNPQTGTSTRPYNYFNTQASKPDNGFQVEKPDNFFPDSDESRSYVRFLKMMSEREEMPRNVWEGLEFNARQPFPGSSRNEHLDRSPFNDSVSNSQYTSWAFFQRNPVAQKLLSSQNSNRAFISKRPSFHPWSGKRNAFKKIHYKRPSFHSWSGKRDIGEIVTTFKRPSFHSWSGKRDVSEISKSIKRPSFHSWSGKRDSAGSQNVISKRPSFHSWSGKREAREIPKSIKRPSFHSWSGKRDGSSNVNTKRPSFHSWSGKRDIGEIVTTFKRPSFHSWSGKRGVNQNMNTKRPSFHSWSGKRDSSRNVIFKRPTFHSWSGKRDISRNVIFKRPTFHSWSGKR